MAKMQDVLKQFEDAKSAMTDRLAEIEAEAQELRAALGTLNGSVARRGRPPAATGETNRAPRGQVRETLIAALGKTPLKPAAIIQATGLTAPQINNTLQLLKKDGIVKKTSEGWTRK
jgi:predicted Rossmann fold nucleotide-binding protein DprA/Smf involved in DNA uptake